jgi:hypothetical protein
MAKYCYTQAYKNGLECDSAIYEKKIVNIAHYKILWSLFPCRRMFIVNVAF